MGRALFQMRPGLRLRWRQSTLDGPVFSGWRPERSARSDRHLQSLCSCCCFLYRFVLKFTFNARKFTLHLAKQLVRPSDGPRMAQRFQLPAKFCQGLSTNVGACASERVCCPAQSLGVGCLHRLTEGGQIFNSTAQERLVNLIEHRRRGGLGQTSQSLGHRRVKSRSEVGGRKSEGGGRICTSLEQRHTSAPVWGEVRDVPMRNRDVLTGLD